MSLLDVWLVTEELSSLPACLAGVRRGQPYASYVRVLSKTKGRELEMRDAARVAMKHPLWTVAEDSADLDFVLEAAGWVGG